MAHRWQNGRCENGHDITSEENIGYHLGKRYCQECRKRRDFGKNSPVNPWPNGRCPKGHDVSRKRQALKRRVNGVWTLACRECEKPQYRAPVPDLTLYGKPEEWMDHGLCRGADPADFFNFHNARVSAQKYCNGCPVRYLCGAYADEKKLDGLWGGVYRRPVRTGTGYRLVRVDYFRQLR